MTTAQIYILVSIVIYLAVMVLIGAYFSKQTSDVGDFYLGGRRLGPVVTAMSAEASDMSSWLLMGLPGVALLSGVADAGWTAIGLAIGTYLNWLFIAKKLRNYSAHLGAITVPDYFSYRYKKSSSLLLIAALMIVVFFVPYTASGFAACGKLFGTLFGIDYHIAMVVSAVIIVGYTSLGGFNAASTTDLIQSIVMTIALVIVVVFGISKAGGMSAVIDNANNLPGFLDMFNTYNAETKSADKYSLLTICSTLAWGLGYFGMPHILLRFMAIENPSKVKTSRRIATVWVVISMAIAVLIGVVGLGMLNNGAFSTEGAATVSGDSETIIIQIAKLISTHGIVPALIAGVILAGILASTMSTSDSQLLAASSAASENILKGVFKLKVSERAEMVVARLTLIIMAVIGVAIAWDSNSSVFGIVSFAWAGFGATFAPVIILSLFWRRSNKYGALAGMIAGGAMVFIWKFLIAKLGGVFTIYELLPAFIFALIVNVIVSLITKEPDEEITSTFDEMKNFRE